MTPAFHQPTSYGYRGNAPELSELSAKWWKRKLFRKTRRRRRWLGLSSQQHLQPVLVCNHGEQKIANIGDSLCFDDFIEREQAMCIKTATSSPLYQEMLHNNIIVVANIKGVTEELTWANRCTLIANYFLGTADCISILTDQIHSRSSKFVPTESHYMTFCRWLIVT